MRRSDALLLLFALLLLLSARAAIDAQLRRLLAEERQERLAAIVGRLQLTDLVLTTEARYTRHPSQADRFAPFQDHPGALEHFPSGSVIAPPPALREGP